jgi:hypothetical protein
MLKAAFALPKRPRKVKGAVLCQPGSAIKRHPNYAAKMECPFALASIPA